ncbi:MAG: EAL domain-containing protein [Rhodocyclaceae bacterium]|nr:EAL domain-containing protein [Rhodocyclaceae bacterium]MBX3668807.1 EAL domain-containing protein [Rhodocyclaceae bacterium]
MTAVKVLVVEDERIIALNLKRQLESLDYKVVGLAASGTQAIRLAHDLQPDLVLMDINLDGAMDGIEAATLIHAEQGTPVVFLTAYSEDSILKRAQESLPFGYLVKPAELRELHATVQMALARHTAERELERGKERLRLALEAAEMSVWEWDSGSDQVASSGYVKAMLGWVPEPVHEPWAKFLDRVHPDDRAPIAAAMRTSLDNEGPLNFTFRTRPDAGDIRWIEVHAKAYGATASQPERVVGILQDITERRRVDEQLRQAGVVFNTTAEAIFVTDAERRIVSVNPAFTVITGYAAAEALGADVEVLIHARRHSDPFYPRLAKTEDGKWQGETYCRRKDGTVFPAWESLAVVRDTDGQVSHYVCAFSDISAMRQAEDRLNHLAHHDQLTGLPNRLLFADRMDHAIEQALRKGARCALLFLDLDDFKQVNDTLGHDAGDLLLKTVAARIKTAARASDTPARLGGDEFVVILDDIAHPEDAAVLARKLLETVAQPVLLGAETVTVKTSMGIAIYPDDGGDRHALLKAADTAMYSAKQQGRNRFCFHTGELAARASQRMRIEQGLRSALATDAMLLYYQPLVRASDRQMVAVEALLRWKHPEFGLLAPASFIDVADDTGVIAALGSWVLRQACNDMMAWQRTMGSTLRVAVNMSARQFSLNPRLVQEVREVLAASGLAPELLEIEVTEGTLQGLEQNMHLLNGLKDLGLRIAIDDFGSGHSSLAVLKHLPISRLKVASSFVREVGGKGPDAAIIQAIVNMSRTLGLTVTAEGVETAAQADLLSTIGCEELQGFLFGRPMPLEELVRSDLGRRPRA